MRSTLVLLALFTCLLAASHSASANGPIVSVTEGALEGTVLKSGVLRFVGIPYAEPPVGELRWKAPLPPKPWAGVRSAQEFGPRPMQSFRWADMLFRSPPASEDCLYLNVWTPATPGPHPVLFYIHGGGHVAGDGSEKRYDGELLASKGIVVVTVNYRLGIFGFFAHPELAAETPQHAAGNYAFLDHVAALKWVQSNIGRFGGDPTRVTIGGQSAGAASTSALLLAPMARGLFSGAIVQSGSMLFRRSLTDLATAEEQGLAFARSIGRAGISELRALPADELLKVSESSSFRFGGIVDGAFLTESPLTTLAAGRQADVPVIIGWATEEVSGKELLSPEQPTVDGLRRALQRLFGEQAGAVEKHFSFKDDAGAEKAAAAVASEQRFAIPTWKWSELQARSGSKPVYRYLFDRRLPGEKPQTPRPEGARHADDLPYWFGTLDLLDHLAWDNDDRLTSEAMQAVVVNFVTTGNPNGPGVPHWADVRKAPSKAMIFRAAPTFTQDTGLERRQFLDTLMEANR